MLGIAIIVIIIVVIYNATREKQKDKVRVPGSTLARVFCEILKSFRL